jgi:ribonuclease D
MMDSELRLLDGDIDNAARDQLREFGREHGLAIDLETTGLSPHRDRIQVVSLAVPGMAVVVPLEKGTIPSGISQLIANTSILKIFHNATFDVGFIRFRFDLPVEPVFCTKIAARLADVHRNPNLDMLVQQLLGVPLSKKERLSDWTTRPLAAAQVEYAAADVRYLHDLKVMLERQLLARGRWILFEACMRFLNTRVELGFLGLDDVFAYDVHDEPIGIDG